MNLTMQQPVSYPFYMGAPRFPFAASMDPDPLPLSTHVLNNNISHHHINHLLHISSVSYPLPFILSHQPQQNPYQKPLPSPFHLTRNMRYNHLKQSTSHINRNRSSDIPVQSPRYSVPESFDTDHQKLNPSLIFSKYLIPMQHTYLELVLGIQ